MTSDRVRALSAVLYVAAGVLFLLLLRFVQYAPLGHDEVEHAHVSWRLLQGDRPYIDFPQNHTPTVWWVGAAALRVLPHSAGGVLALRWLAFGTLLVAMFAGWRMLVRLKPDTGQTVYPLALIGMMCLAWRLEWWRFRPDPFMSLFATLGVAVMIRRDLTPARAGAAGVLLGLAAIFSPKMWPILGLLPLRAAYDAWAARRGGPLLSIATYSAGGVVGALPLFAWLAANNLWAAFLNDVVAFNGGFAKPPEHAFRFLQRPLLLAALAGAALIAWQAWRRGTPARWPSFALAAVVPLGLSIVFLSVHSSLYNQQVVTIPAAIGFAFLGASIAGRRASAARLLLLALFLTVSVRREVTAIVQASHTDWHIGRQELDALIGFARASGGGPCAGFAPCHPVFCADAGPVSLLWDVLFLEHPVDEAQQRFARYWRESAAAVSREQPALVVDRCDGVSPWEAAGDLHALAPATLGRLRRTLEERYQPYDLDRSRVWVRR